jgi:sugar lactone lactonase YvrE
VRAVQATERCTYHGEGPFWDPRVDRLLFVDMLAGAVLEWDLAGPIRRHPVGRVAAVIRARARGGYVLALEQGFALAGDGLDVVETLAPVLTDERLRLNEGGCDPQGRFYCGSMAYAETPGHGTLYRLSPDRSVDIVLTGVGISNGLQWSRDGATAFYVDSLTGRVDAFDFDGETGAFSNRRPFVTIDGAAGFPDGTAIDEDDGLWVALWNGGAVHRYDARGRLTEVIELPVPKVTACAFGGADRTTLYITTSRKDMSADEFPQAGALFSVQAGIRGAPQHAFAG